MTELALGIIAAVVLALVRGYWRLHSRVTRLEALEEARRRNGASSRGPHPYE